MPDEIYDVYDSEGNKIGKASWTEVHMKGLLHHTTAILIFKDSSKKEVLLQRRSGKMKQDPGLWQHSAGGHMLAGETPEENVEREMQEELFSNRKLPKLKIRKIASFFNNDMPNNNEILHVFETIYSGSFYFDKEELQKIKWVEFKKLLEDVKKNPGKYTQAFRNVIREYMKAQNKK